MKIVKQVELDFLIWDNIYRRLIWSIGGWISQGPWVQGDPIRCSINKVHGGVMWWISESPFILWNLQVASKPWVSDVQWQQGVRGAKRSLNMQVLCFVHNNQWTILDSSNLRLLQKILHCRYSSFSSYCAVDGWKNWRTSPIKDCWTVAFCCMWE